MAYRKRAMRGRSKMTTMQKARYYRSRGLAAYGRTLYNTAKKLASYKNPVHWFRKEVPFTSFNQPAGGGNIHGIYYFQAYSLPDWNDLKDVYDQYLVKKIIITFEPQYNGTNASAVPPYQRWMRVVHDYNDATTLGSENEYLEYGNCKSYNLTSNKLIRVTLYPKIQNIVSTANSTSAGKVSNPGWLNTSADDVPMYGIKFFLPDLGIAAGYTIARMRVTAIIGCKNVR